MIRNRGIRRVILFIMRSLADTVRKNLTEQNMAKPGDTVICAVSGGADSVCLLAVLFEIAGGEKHSLPLSLYCVHVHHGIRGAEADEDAAYVRDLCASFRIPFMLRAVDAPGMAKQTAHTSLEEAARILRYETLAQAAKEIGEKASGRVRIAVAHHMDDNAETVLLNLFRGTGIRGLSGIRPAGGAIIRPLYNIPRTEIEAFLAEKGLAYRTDRTNLVVTYARNRIRTEILANAGTNINARAILHIARAAEDVREAGRFLDRCVDAAHERCKTTLPSYLADTKGVWYVLSVSALRKEDDFLRRELFSRLLHRVSGGAHRQVQRQGMPVRPEEAGDFAGADGTFLPPRSSYYQIRRAHIGAVNRLVLSGNGRADLDLPGKTHAARRYDFLIISVV